MYGYFIMVFFFKKKKPAKGYDGKPLDPEWARNRKGKFSRLSHLDPAAEGINGLGGVYVIWHSGVKPGWVYVGRSDDIGAALQDALENEDIMEYERNGGLYVTWSPVLKRSQNGVLRFLHEGMKPKVPNPIVGDIKDGPINVLAPKRKGTT